ncbi:MAG: ComEC family competence protein [Cyanobacteria bacterium]|nr:ComEC family competence protein [Cyanobacteriota bacterium]
MTSSTPSSDPLTKTPAQVSDLKFSSTRSWLSHSEPFLVPLLGCLILGLTLGCLLANGLLSPGVIKAQLYLFAASLGSFSLFLALYRKRRWVIQTAFCTFALSAGCLWSLCFAYTPGYPDVSYLSPQPNCVIRGIIWQRPSENAHATLWVYSVNGQTLHGYADISKSPSAFPAAGQWVEVHGNLSTPWPARFPGAYDQRHYLLAQQIGTVITRVKLLKVLNEAPDGFNSGFNLGLNPSTWQTFWMPAVSPLLHWSNQTQMTVQTHFQKALGQQYGSILASMVLGDRAVPVDRELKQDFARTGLIHLLAASGFNVAIIAGFCLWCLTRLRVIPRPMVYLASMGMVALYVILAGFSPSVLRAGVMLEIALLLSLWDKAISGVLLLFLATALLALFQPIILLSLSFQLSALTTLGLLLMAPGATQWCQQKMMALLPVVSDFPTTLLQFFIGLITVPSIAQLWVLPISITVFHQIPLLSIPLNGLAGLIVVPLTVLGFIASFFATVLPAIASILCYLAVPFLWALLNLATGIGADPAMRVELGDIPNSVCCIAYALLILWGFLLQNPIKWQPSLKQRVAIALCAGFCLILPSIVEKQHYENAFRLERIPLSSYSSAWFVYLPGKTSRPGLIVPQTLGHWETRTIKDYFKHHQIKAISWVYPLNQSHESLSEGNDRENILQLLKREQLKQGDSEESQVVINWHEEIRWGGATWRFIALPERLEIQTRQPLSACLRLSLTRQTEMTESAPSPPCFELSTETLPLYKRQYQRWLWNPASASLRLKHL